MLQITFRFRREKTVYSGNRFLTQMQPPLFVKSTLDFQEQKDFFHLSAFGVGKFYDVKIFSWKKCIGNCSTFKKMLTETVIEDMEKLFWKSESEIKKIKKIAIFTISWYDVSSPSNQTQKKTGKEHCRNKGNVTRDSDWRNVTRDMKEFRFAFTDKTTFYLASMGKVHLSSSLWQSRLLRRFQWRTFWEQGNCQLTDFDRKFKTNWSVLLQRSTIYMHNF